MESEISDADALGFGTHILVVVYGLEGSTVHHPPPPHNTPPPIFFLFLWMSENFGLHSLFLPTSIIMKTTARGRYNGTYIMHTNYVYFQKKYLILSHLVFIVATKNTKKHWCKPRLEGQINELRKDLSRIEQMDKGTMKDSDMRNRLMKK